MPSQKVAERMDGNNPAYIRRENGVLLMDHFLEKYLQGLPDAAAYLGKQFPVIKEIPPQEGFVGAQLNL